MPWHQLIIGLPGFTIESVVDGGVKLTVHARYGETARCSQCSSTDLRKKDRYLRRVRHVCFGDKLTELIVEAFKFYCKVCKRYFRQRFPGILPRKRASEPFRRQVSRQHHQGITQKDLASKMAVGCATVERWYHDYIRLEHAKTSGNACPRVLGIDEHFFTKKRGFATTFVDLRKNRVFDVRLGRSKKSLAAYLSTLKGREKVEVVVMDLSETYRSIVRHFFPNAKIVADRFHVIRLINHHFMATWKQLDSIGRLDRGLISLMRRHPWNLRDDQPAKLARYLAEIPGLQAVYDFKQRLTTLLLVKHQKRRECIKLIPQFLEMIQQMKSSPMPSLSTLGYTMESWAEEIARMWRFTKTNSITEGLHNKMEMITRRAYGMRNFENYRLRVRVHCGY